LTAHNVGTNILNASHSVHAAATHPETGQVYEPYGYYGLQENAYTLLRFDPGPKKIDGIRQPADFRHIREYAVTWNRHPDALLLFGGIDYDDNWRVTSSLHRFDDGDNS
ncbi:hypothetical protein BG005_004724, partial [Podila minutissima]